MKLFKFCLLFSLFFTQCLAMERHPTRSASAPTFDSNVPKQETSRFLNPHVFAILNELKTKNAKQSLQPEDFWLMMAASTDMGSCFLGEFIANAEEDDVCLVINYMIKFGQNDTTKFYECMIGCTGNDGITPLNELIRYIKSKDSKIYKFFLQLLNLIKTLETRQIFYLLNQKDLYVSETPVEIATQQNKLFISGPIADILLNAILPATPIGSPTWSPDESSECRFVDQPSEKF